MSSPDGMTIGEVAARTGLSVHALRFYEREGLLAGQVRRGPDGRRRYSEQDVEWVQTCVRFRSAGMPLLTIRRYASLVREGPGNEQQRLAILGEHETTVIEQIRRLNEALELVRVKAASYQRDLATGTSRCTWPAATPS